MKKNRELCCEQMELEKSRILKAIDKTFDKMKEKISTGKEDREEEVLHAVEGSIERIEDILKDSGSSISDKRGHIETMDNIQVDFSSAIAEFSLFEYTPSETNLDSVCGMLKESSLELIEQTRAPSSRITENPRRTGLCRKAKLETSLRIGSYALDNDDELFDDDVGDYDDGDIDDNYGDDDDSDDDYYVDGDIRVGGRFACTDEAKATLYTTNAGRRQKE